MSRPKKRAAAGLPEASRRIAALRDALGLTQEDFAGRLSVSRIAVVNWESGKSQPAAQNYIEIAKVAKEIKPSMAVWFWRQAGIDDAALKSLLPEFKKAFAQAQQRVQAMLSAPLEGVVRLPLLRTVAHLDAPSLAPSEDIEMWVPVPAFLVLNPNTTSCVRTPAEASSLGGEELWLLDSSERSLNRLWGHMVLAYCDLAPDGEPLGVYAGFLHPFTLGKQQIPMLVPTRRPEDAAALDDDEFDIRYEPPIEVAPHQKIKRAKVSGLAARMIAGYVTPLAPDVPWRILGRVVGAISSIQPRRGDSLREASTASLAHRAFATRKPRRGGSAK